MKIMKLKKVSMTALSGGKDELGFTGWLCGDGMEYLSKEVGFDIEYIKNNKKFGEAAYADILAKTKDGAFVIIENQLGQTDHKHLGELLTYASNSNAGTVIWIAEDIKDDHKKAILWLNENIKSVAFYLIKLEVYKNRNSELDPRFHIIVSPRRESRVIKMLEKEHKEIESNRIKFCSSLLERSKEKTQLHSNITPSRSALIQAGSGKALIWYRYSIANNQGTIALYIDTPIKRKNKKLFDKLYSHKKEIEKTFGDKLQWDRMPDNKASQIIKKFIYSGLGDKEKWSTLQNKMISGMIRLEKALNQYVKLYR